MPHAAYLLGLRLEPVAKCSFASLTNGIFPVFSVHSSPPCSFKFLQTFCVLAVCHFAVAWQWSDKTKDVAGCMANGLQERRALHCSWPALVLPVLCSCPALALLLAISCPTTDLHLTSSHSSAARQRVSSEWATDSPKLCSPATACYAHADERRRFCFCCCFFCHCSVAIVVTSCCCWQSKACLANSWHAPFIHCSHCRRTTSIATPPPAIIFINFSQKGIYVAKRTGHSAQL